MGPHEVSDRIPRRTARAVLEKGDAVATGKVVSGLLRAVSLNLWGLGATVIGLQVGNPRPPPPGMRRTCVHAHYSTCIHRILQVYDISNDCHPSA